MCARKQSNRLDAVRDAATGYAVIVLAVVCFILALIVVMAGVRIVGELGSGSTTTAATVVAGNVGGTK